MIRFSGFGLFPPIMTVIFGPPGHFDELPLLAVHLPPELRDHSLLLHQDLVPGPLQAGLDHLLSLMMERCYKQKKVCEERKYLGLGTSDWILIYCARDREDRPGAQLSSAGLLRCRRK